LFHPGEKRLVAHVLAKCPRHPPEFETQVHELLSAVAPSGQPDVLGRVNDLLDGLDALLSAERLITPETRRQAST